MRSYADTAALLSRKSAFIVDQLCQIMHAYPKRGGELKLYTEVNQFANPHIDNGYFTISYSGITGVCMINVLPEHNNQVLRNYFEATGNKFFRIIYSLEELEEFCETAKWIGGMGDEHGTN